MLAADKTTCARVILMALTGDGSMSTSCCTELRVCITLPQRGTHIDGRHPNIHTHTQTRAAAVEAHRVREGLIRKKIDQGTSVRKC